MKRKFWSFFYRIYAVWLGVRSSGSIQLGSNVIYEGVKYVVINGATCDKWDLIGDDRTRVKAPRKECHRVRSIFEWVHGFRNRYRWFMTNWHSIYVNRKIYHDFSEK